MASEHRLQENVRTLVPLSFLRLLKKIYRSLRVQKIFGTNKLLYLAYFSIRTLIHIEILNIINILFPPNISLKLDTLVLDYYM